jgi:hypothetical protein
VEELTVQRERFRTRRWGCEENDIPQWKLRLLLVASTLGDDLWLEMRRSATSARIATEEWKRACAPLAPPKAQAISRVFSSLLTSSEHLNHNNRYLNFCA